MDDACVFGSCPETKEKGLYLTEIKGKCSKCKKTFCHSHGDECYYCEALLCRKKCGERVYIYYGKGSRLQTRACSDCKNGARVVQWRLTRPLLEARSDDMEWKKWE